MKASEKRVSIGIILSTAMLVLSNAYLPTPGTVSFAVAMMWIVPTALAAVIAVFSWGHLALMILSHLADNYEKFKDRPLKTGERSWFFRFILWVNTDDEVK